MEIMIHVGEAPAMLAIVKTLDPDLSIFDFFTPKDFAVLRTISSVLLNCLFAESLKTEPV